MIKDILIISDTHGRVSRLEELISYRRKLLAEGEVLNLIFLGDGLDDLFACRSYDEIITYAVRGNCDSTRFSPCGKIVAYATVARRYSDV